MNADNKIAGVYVMRASDSHYIKIGEGANGKQRRNDLSTGCPTTLSIVNIIPVADYADREFAEKYLQKVFESHKIPNRREWFFRTNRVNKFVNAVRDSSKQELEELAEYILAQKDSFFDDLTHKLLDHFIKKQQKSMGLEKPKEDRIEDKYQLLPNDYEYTRHAYSSRIRNRSQPQGA